MKILLVAGRVSRLEHKKTRQVLKFGITFLSTRLYMARQKCCSVL
jgi:hypothetical protein